MDSMLKVKSKVILTALLQIIAYSEQNDRIARSAIVKIAWFTSIAISVSSAL